MCREHHRDFELNVWPIVRGILTRELATLHYIVHGERFHEWVAWNEPKPRVGVSPHQLRLEEAAA